MMIDSLYKERQTKRRGSAGRHPEQPRKHISETSGVTEKEPLVSIVIPVYNVSAYLPECLESLMYQTYPNIEILVIDDGSTDGSGEICEAYARKDSRIRLFHQENHGISFARNVGISRARGEFLMFLDSDDWVERDAVEILLRAMLPSRADIVIAGYAEEYKGKTVRPSLHQEPFFTVSGASVLPDFFGGRISGLPWDKLYRAGCFEEIRFPVGRNYEDISTLWKLMKRLSENGGTVAVLPDCLFHYRVRKSSVSHTCSLRNVTDYWTAYTEQYDSLPAYRDQILEGCFVAIGKMWVAYSGLSEEEKKRAEPLVREMRRFSKANFQKVMKGRYPGRVRLYCALSQTDSPAVRRLCRLVGKPLMLFRENLRKRYN